MKDLITDRDMIDNVGYYYETTGGGCDAYVKRQPFVCVGNGKKIEGYELELIITDGDLNCPASFPCEIGALLYYNEETNTVLDSTTAFNWKDIADFTDHCIDRSNEIITTVAMIMDMAEGLK